MALTLFCLAVPAHQSAADPIVSATVLVGLTPSYSNLGGIQFNLLNDPGADVGQALVTALNEALNSTMLANRDALNNKTTVGWLNTTGITTSTNPLFSFVFPITNGAYPRFSIDASGIDLVDSFGGSFSATAANFVISTAYLTQAGITQYFLNYRNSGIGSGTVTSDAGNACTADCSTIYSSGASVTLFPTPGSDSYFAGWSGSGCSGTGNCAVTINRETTVIANFDVHPPVNLGVAYYPLIAQAYALSADGATINIRAVDLIESPVFNSPLLNPIAVTLKGGFDGTFNSAIGYTRINGSMTIASGAVTIDNLILM